MPVPEVFRILDAVEETLLGLRAAGSITEAQVQQGVDLLAHLRDQDRPVSPEENTQALAWLQRQGGFAAVFGVNGSFWEGLFQILISTPSEFAKVRDTLLGRVKDSLQDGPSLPALLELIELGGRYYIWDVEVRKRWKQSLEELLLSVAKGEIAGLRRIVVIAPQLPFKIPSIVGLLGKKLATRDGEFFIQLGKALKTGNADRKQRRAVDAVDHLLLLGAAFLKNAALSDADLLRFLKEKAIVSGAVDTTWLKIRRQRLGVGLRPKGRRKSTVPPERNGKVSKHGKTR